MWQRVSLQVLLLALIYFSTVESARPTRYILNPHTQSTSTVQYNEQGVPFITATNLKDLLYTQGYVVAENRLWEMEVYRRLALGTVSEIFGQDFVPIDADIRRMKYLEIATKNMQNTPTQFLLDIEYYDLGVNGFLDAAALDPSLMPPEFAEYNAPFPAPYSIVDSFLIVKILATGLSGNARNEPGYQTIFDKVGLSRFNQLMARDPDMPYVLPPYHHSNYSRADSQTMKNKMKNQQNNAEEEIIPTDINFDEWKVLNNISNFHIPFAGVNRMQQINEDLSNPIGEFLKIFNPTEFTRASNSWAVSGRYTESGLPIFSNDPHLQYTAPMIWFFVGLHLDAPNSKWNHIIGSTLVLTPGVGIGRNEHIAWGYTMVQSDNQDLFIMDNLPGNSQYNYNGTVLNYEITTETIYVKDSDPVNITVVWSVLGPVFPAGDTYYSLHWTNLYDTDTSVQALILQNEASNYNEYLSAVENWWSLCFNAMFADDQGNIGYKTTGATPLRRKGNHGDLPRSGNGSHNWLGLIPISDMPTVVNPTQGFLVSANNPIAPDSALVHPIYGYFDVGFRSQRIIDMIIDNINDQTKFSVNYSSSIQASVVNLQFSYLYSTVKNLILTDSDALQWQSNLLNWDGDETVTSKEATIYEEFVHCLYNVTYFEIGRSWTDSYFIAQVFNNATASGAGDDIACSYWNITCVGYASNCFTNVVSNYRVRVPQWGDLPHFASFPHLLPVPVDGYSRFVSVGGSANTPNAAHSIGGARGPVLAGPSMRLIADMSGTVPNQMVLPMGESGVPSSPHYDDQLAAWAANQLYEVDWAMFSNSK